MEKGLDREKIKKACLQFALVSAKLGLNNAEFITALHISLDTTLELVNTELCKAKEKRGCQGFALYPPKKLFEKSSFGIFKSFQ